MKRNSSFYSSPDAMIVDLMCESAILGSSVSSVNPTVNVPGQVIKGGF